MFSVVHISKLSGRTVAGYLSTKHAHRSDHFPDMSVPEFPLDGVFCERLTAAYRP